MKIYRSKDTGKWVVLITIRNPWLLYMFGWTSTPSYVEAHIKLWIQWVWKGPDYSKFW